MGNHISSFFSHPLITLAPNMFMPSRLPFLAASLLSLAGSLAAPIDDLAKRIVISPEITSPTAETVWKAGSTVTVTWSTELLEEYPEAQNYTGTIYLGFTEDGSLNQNLDVDNPLADGFPLSAGTVSATLAADTEARDNAIIALLGDSGNISPRFTIVSA